MVALRSFSTVPYLPVLAVSPSEMRALEELPERDKDALLPLFRLRSWGVAHHLESTMERIAKAYGDRPYVGDLCPPEVPTGEPRPVHAELQQLRQPARGYANWCSFVEEHPNIIPTIQLGDLRELDEQVVRLRDLGRGLAVYLHGPALRLIANLAPAIGGLTKGGADLCFVIDLGQRGSDLLVDQASATAYVNAIRAIAPSAVVAISASTFPSGFVSLDAQDIYERAHFEGVVRQLGRAGLIYSDRGSARAEKQMGGGGTPAPRVDLAGSTGWAFFRDGDETNSRPQAYKKQAMRAMASPAWDAALKLWGCQMIERTALGDRDAVKSPSSSTAARINIHLHQQLFYGNQPGLYETDEEWDD